MIFNVQTGRTMFTSSPLSSRWIIRKCLIVIVIFTITCCNIYFKRYSNNNHKRASNHHEHGNNHQEDNRKHGPSKPIDPLLQSNNGYGDANHNYAFHSDNNDTENGAILAASSVFHSRSLQQVSLKQPNKTKEVTDDSSLTSHNKTYKMGPKTPLIPLIDSKNISCIDPAYMEFPPDLFSVRARARGAIIVHIAVVCYMFYCLAVVCDHYFLPSLEECAQRLNLSQDVAGATFMAAGSSAPELFTAILGVFIAKGDVGTGTIVGSAVFNILFVIGLCSLFTDATELNWWPVARDSSYYTFTVLLLIMCIYDGEVTAFESFIMLFFYCIYIVIMKFNHRIRDLIYQQWQLRFPSKPVDELNNLKGNTIQAVHYKSFQENDEEFGAPTQFGQMPPQAPEARNPFLVRIPEVTLFEAANQIIIKYKRLFRAKTRFRSAAHLIIIRSRKAKEKHAQLDRTISLESRKISVIGPDVEFWRTIPNPNTDDIMVCVKWLAVAPLYASLHYTIPDCKSKKNMFLATFFASIVWTALFSYVMVWMVTMIGFTLGIPDSIMGITFLAAGTSVPDAYASMHVAKLGQADMAVSNSIGSNVFDILVGLALPWFVETTIVEPGTVSSINSGGLVYAVILLFLSLLATIYLFHRNNWTLNPSLGYSLLGTYAAFLIISSAIEFNLFGYVNPPICGE